MNKKKTKNAGAMAGAIALTGDIAKLQASALRACNVLKAMASPVRLMVLCQIAHGEESVRNLAKSVGLSQSALSQHLAVLRNKNLVTARRDGQSVLYSLSSPEVVAIMETLYELYCRGAAVSAPLKRPTRAPKHHPVHRVS